MRDQKPLRTPRRPEMPDPATWVDRYGDYLFRFAVGRVRDAAEAEDLVQETLLAALKGRHQFDGRSSVPSWLVGILKRKIIDRIRATNRQRAAGDLGPDDPVFARLFDSRGKWRKPPGDWGDDPSAALERREFWDVLRHCLGKLPGRLAEAFTLREIEQMNSKEVRNVLGVTATNLGVLLHRARLRLARCLDVNWFGERAS